MYRTHALLAGASLFLGALLVLQLQAQESREKTPTEREPITATRRICDAGGSRGTWGSSEYGYPYANRVIAMSPDGRWLAFPFLESLEIEKSATPFLIESRWSLVAGSAGERTTSRMGWWVNLCDLTAPPGSECPRWRQGEPGRFGMHSPVVAGPHNAVAFLVDDPFQRTVDGLLPPEYIRVCWCGTGKCAYYRLPAGPLKGPRPIYRSRLIDLWFAENPVTEKPSLFTLLFDGTLCLWTLRDSGFPTTANLLVEDEPQTLDLYDLVEAVEKTKKARPDESVFGLFAVAHASNRIALCNPDQPPIRVISLASGRVRTLDVPKSLGDAPYQDLLLSENGRYCTAFRPEKRAGDFDSKREDESRSSMPPPDYPNVMETWDTETGALLWQRTLPERHFWQRERFFFSRAAFSPDSTLLVTWSCPDHDHKRDRLEMLDAPSDEERQRRWDEQIRRWEERFQKGVLQLWDAATGKPSGTLPFSLRHWRLGLAFTPDGKQIAVLEHGGACSFVETAAFRPAP